jgi:hypothetical protein
MSLNTLQRFCAACLLGLLPIRTGQAQAQTNLPSTRPVVRGDSTMVRNARVYSIKFPGGTAAEFFEFLRTNGFASDNVLFAGKAASVQIPAFEVRHVRLTDVGKALETVSEGRLNVEVVEKGEQTDENIWRIKSSPGGARITAKTCAMPHFFRKPDAIGRFQPIVNAAAEAVAKDLDLADGAKHEGRTHMLPNEKIVIVVGPATYVEAVTSALEAVEKVAAADAQTLNAR